MSVVSFVNPGQVYAIVSLFMVLTYQIMFPWEVNISVNGLNGKGITPDCDTLNPNGSGSTVTIATDFTFVASLQSCTHYREILKRKNAPHQTKTAALVIFYRATSVKFMISLHSTVIFFADVLHTDFIPVNITYVHNTNWVWDWTCQAKTELQWDFTCNGHARSMKFLLFLGRG